MLLEHSDHVWIRFPACLNNVVWSLVKDVVLISEWEGKDREYRRLLIPIVSILYLLHEMDEENLGCVDVKEAAQADVPAGFYL